MQLKTLCSIASLALLFVPGIHAGLVNCDDAGCAPYSTATCYCEDENNGNIHVTGNCDGSPGGGWCSYNPNNKIPS
ncbi:hypothetical protein BST61_g5491 [Cercospora zeina]